MTEAGFGKVRAVRAHELIVGQLQRRILGGELPAGSRLPSERAMMEQFAVSRPTVREALRVAEHLGLVSVRQGDPGGPLVRAQPSAGIAHVLDGMVDAERMSLGDLVELRVTLDGSAARLAARQGKAAAPRIAAVLGQMREAEDLEAFAQLDAKFHHEVAVASGNRLFALVLEALDGPVRGLIAKTLAAPRGTPARDATMAQHAAILDAIRHGDGEAAAQAARHHLIDFYSPALDRAARARLRSIAATLIDHV